MGLTRVQHALQLYCPFVDVPELDPLHEDIDAAKDDLYLAKSSDRRSRTGPFATSTVVTISFDKDVSLTVGRSTGVIAFAMSVFTSFFTTVP